MADQLDAYIDQARDVECGGRHPTEGPIVDALRLSASSVEPDPDFVEGLSARLRREPEPSPSRRQGWVPKVGWIKRAFEGGMTMKKGLALAAAAAALILAIVLPVALGGDQARSPLPRLVHASGSVPRPPSGGLLADVTLTLTTDLPQTPDEVFVYRATLEPVPGTPEEALEWARDFGLPDPRVYRDPGDRESIFVLGSDGRRLIFRSGPGSGISYNDPAARTVEGPQPSFEHANEAAESFLRQHDLLPADYRIEDPQGFQPNLESPTRPVEVVPLLDGRPVMGGQAHMRVSVNAEGQVTYASLGQPITFERGESYSIKSARQAYEMLKDDEPGSPFRLDGDVRAPVESEVRHYRPEPPTHAVGDVVTAAGWVQVLIPEPVPSAVERHEGDARAELTARDGVQYDLTGPRVVELTEARSNHQDVTIQGEIIAQLGEHRWEVRMTDWESVPAQHEPGSDVRAETVVGVFTPGERDGWLATDDGKRYRLPRAPEELREGERIQVWLNQPPVDGDDLDWASITSPPTSGPEEVVVGSTSVRVVSVEEVEAHIGEPPTAPTPPGHTHVVQKGETLRMIADQYDVTVDDLLEANPELDAHVISMGQVLLIPEASAGEGGPPATATPVPIPTIQLPFEIGETVEISGVLHATIYEGEESRRVEAGLVVDDGPQCPLSGPLDVLEDVAQLDGLHVRVRGEVTSTGQARTMGGYAIAVEAFEKVWPEEHVEGFLGHVEEETLEGETVAVFTDHETEQRYVVASSLEGEGPGRSIGPYPSAGAEQYFVVGVVQPGETFAGMPVLRIRRQHRNSQTEAATSADEIPLEIPEVIDESRAFPGPFPGLEGALLVDRADLVYYYEPTAPYPATAPGGTPLTPEPVEQIVQPVWVFYGHDEDDTVRFTAYIQAAADDLIGGTGGAEAATPTPSP
ncbi:MAG: LysM peptidoglycan-binding domain-containing protein [Chloroflexota bacterium]